MSRRGGSHRLASGELGPLALTQHIGVGRLRQWQTERTAAGIGTGTIDVPDERDLLAMQRDAVMVSVLAYAGLRPGELRALRRGDVRRATLTVERAARPDGTVKATKTHERRAVRLLAPLAADLAALRLACGRPTDETLILDRDGEPWTKIDWQVWRARRWNRACQLAGLPRSPRPYDLRHSFASLLLAEGRSVHYVARQLGHSPALTLSTYGHLFAEYEHADRIDAESEIVQARRVRRPPARHVPARYPRPA